MAEYDGQGEDAGGSLVMAEPPWGAAPVPSNWQCTRLGWPCGWRSMHPPKLKGGQ